MFTLDWSGEFEHWIELVGALVIVVTVVVSVGLAFGKTVLLLEAIWGNDESFRIGRRKPSIPQAKARRQ